MKNSIPKTLLPGLLLVLFLLPAVLFGKTIAPADAAGAPFKMIIRLWPHHHTDSVLREQLVAALAGHKAACDEVWFCTELGVPPLEVHRQSVRALSRAVERMRGIGVKSSIQIGATIGHGDGFMGDFGGMTWSTVVGADGVATRQCSCPRQSGFLSYLEQIAGMYAACKPDCIWIDDDLRVALHAPAPALCYCPTCIGLFNEKTGGHWTRETLTNALDRNENGGELRRDWIAFGQESLAEVARVIARSVHRVSPETRMGLQHYNGHRELLNGWDWKPVLDAMRQETGMAPASRPGSGFYNDHAPRGMIVKGYDMAVQIHRLPSYVEGIAAEVEGFQHRATGKSPHGLAVESLLYLAMGCDQLSYAILCSAFEPMDWYAHNYLTTLAAWRSFYEEYVRFNRGTLPGGIRPYIGKDHVLRSGENWQVCGSGNMVYALAPLGLPFCPESEASSCLIMDAEAVSGLSDQETVSLFEKGGILLDKTAFNVLNERGLGGILHPVSSDISGIQAYETAGRGRVTCISFDPEISISQRRNLLQAADWVSMGKLPVIVESMAQMQAVPRVDSDGKLRSVTLLNVSISPQESTEVRLRGCRPGCRVYWVTQQEELVELSGRNDGSDVLVTVPRLEGWNIGWLKIVP